MSQDILASRAFHVYPPKGILQRDSLVRIIHVSIGSNNFVSYKTAIILDSACTSVSVLDSLVNDSSLYASFLANDSTLKDSALKISVVKAEDIYARFPIESIYEKRPRLVPFKISYINPLDSLKKNKPIKFNGSIQTIGQLSENKLPYQSIPQNYIRTYTQLNADLYGIPFTAGYNYTTESNQDINKINNFRFSFNYQSFYNNIRNKLDKKLEVGKANQLKSLTDIDVNSLNDEYARLKNELLSKDYQKKLLRNQRIVEYAMTDTSFKKSFKYKKALNYQEANLSKYNRLKELEQLKEQFLKYDKLSEIDRKVASYNLDKPKDFRRAASRYKITKPGQNLLLAVRKLDLGTFDPDYTTLVLSGVSLTGVNLEVNPGKLYAAFTWGKSVANFTNPLNFSSLAGGRNILSGRLGLGNKDNLLVAISVLKGTDDSGNKIKDSLYDYYLPNVNYVLGIDAKYKITSTAEVGIEYAKSENIQTVKDEGSSVKNISSLANSNQAKYSSAFYAYSAVQFNENTTKLKLSTRVIDPFYYSFGTPYLRKDNFRIEAKGEQSFWKKQLTTAITYRRDADNIYNLKQGTSVTNTFLYNLNIRIKKYPYLLLTYSPNYQSLFISSLNTHIKTEVKFYNAVLGYTSSTKKTVSNTSFSYSKQYNNSNQKEWKQFHVDQYALNHTIQLKDLYLTLNGNINYVLPFLSGDTGKVIATGVNATKGLWKNKIQVTLGGRYQKDFIQEERLIAEVGTAFGLGYGIQCQVHIEKHFVTPYTQNIASKDMMLGRITIIKTFSYE